MYSRLLQQTKNVQNSIVLALIILISTQIKAQTDVKIGTNPGNKTASAVLELESTTKGFLLPRMTTDQMKNIASPAEGLLIFNTEQSCVFVYRSSSWLSTCDAATLGGWSLTGNGGTNPSTQFLGTTDGQPVVFRTNGTEAMRLDATGNLGIGVSPSYKLDVSAASNPLRIQGLQGAATTDSLITINSATGVVRKMKITDAIAAGIIATNGLTKTGNSVSLGGTLTSATTLTTSSTNTLAINGLQGGVSTDSIMTLDPITGVLKRRTVADVINNSNTSWLLGGNTLTGTTTIGSNSNHNVGIETNGTTRLTLSNTGDITQSGTGQVTFTGNVDASNGLDVSTGALTATAGSTLTGTTTMNATGAAATTIGNASSTTTIVAPNLNVTGLASGASTDLVMSVTAAGAVRRLTTSEVVASGLTVNNGLTKSSNNVQLGGALTQATTIEQGGNNLNITGGRVGIGSTDAPNSTFHLTGSMSVSYRKEKGDMKVTETDYIVLADATDTDLKVYMPDASSCAGRVYFVGKTDETSHSVTFEPELRLTETTSIANLNIAKKYHIVSDGKDWWIVNE